MPLLRPVAGAAAILTIALAVTAVSPGVASATIAPAAQTAAFDELPSSPLVKNVRPDVGAAAATTLRKLSATPTPAISGKRLVTFVLTAAPGKWSPAPVALTYQWYRSGKAITGATGSRYRLKAADAGKTITVRVRGSKSGHVAVAKKSAATVRIGYPGRTAPVSKWTCPSWAPIKGNADSMIYHVPGARFYKATAPEDCFRTERAAQNAGYRRAKV